jgi:hypothetical protein
MEPGTTTIHAPCSECGHKPVEAASPRWPLWLRTLPWLAALAVIVLAAGLGLRGKQETREWPVGFDDIGIWLPEWTWERVDRASRDAVEARQLRDEAASIADLFSNAVEPGAQLQFSWKDDAFQWGDYGRSYGWPHTWLRVKFRDAPSLTFSVKRVGATFYASDSHMSLVIETASIPIMVLLSLISAWCCVRLISLAFRLRRRRMSNRAAYALLPGFAVAFLSILATAPTPPWWPDRWELTPKSSIATLPTGLTFEAFVGSEVDDQSMLAFAQQLALQWKGPRKAQNTEPELNLRWVNTAEGTLTETFFGTPWPLFSYGTSVCDPPSSGAPTTRFGWPEWRYERLVIWGGTRGFPSRAGYVALEPAGIGIWSFFALIAYWLAALTRQLITRTILRRRQRTAKCQACGYQLSIIKPAS